MGWAKYYEDDLSIYVGRMAIKGEQLICRPAEPYRQVYVSQKTKSKEVKSIIRKPKQNGRRGLELSFANGINEGDIRKLQMNGWWWSKVNACWCNLDTNGNRKYAEHFTSYEGMKLVVTPM